MGLLDDPSNLRPDLGWSWGFARETGISSEHRQAYEQQFCRELKLREEKCSDFTETLKRKCLDYKPDAWQSSVSGKDYLQNCSISKQVVPPFQIPEWCKAIEIDYTPWVARPDSDVCIGIERKNQLKQAQIYDIMAGSVVALWLLAALMLAIHITRRVPRSMKKAG
jgi:hypothetical protein